MSKKVNISAYRCPCGAAGFFVNDGEGYVVQAFCPQGGSCKVCEHSEYCIETFVGGEVLCGWEAAWDHIVSNHRHDDIWSWDPQKDELVLAHKAESECEPDPLGELLPIEAE